MRYDDGDLLKFRKQRNKIHAVHMDHIKVPILQERTEAAFDAVHIMGVPSIWPTEDHAPKMVPGEPEAITRLRDVEALKVPKWSEPTQTFRRLQPLECAIRTVEAKAHNLKIL